MRFGISETSWMLPKILRMRLEAEERVSGALGAVVAMECVSPLPAGRGAPEIRRPKEAFRVDTGHASPVKRGQSPMRVAAKDAKSRESRIVEPQLQRLENPARSMRWPRCATALPVPMRKGCGGYLGARGRGVKALSRKFGKPAIPRGLSCRSVRPASRLLDYG